MKRILFILFFLFSNIVFANIGNPILDNAFNKIKTAQSYKIQFFKKMNFKEDTAITIAFPFIKHLTKKESRFKSSLLKFLFFEPSNSNKWFDLTVMDGNKWHILSSLNNKEPEVRTYELSNENSIANFKSNFNLYSILFFPNKYYNIFKKWDPISDEKIDNEDTWAFEYKFKHELGFNIRYILNINKADTFLRRFTVICSEYEKLHELIEVYTQLDIISHRQLNDDCDTIFDINYQMQKYNSFNKNDKLNNKKENKTESNILIAKDTAKILINSNFITMNGDSIKLSSLKGKWILLDFWYVGCYPCYKAMDFFNKINQKYKNSNLVIYGINPIDNDRKALSRLFNDKGLTYQYLIDPKGKCRNEIGISGFPRMFLISPDQKIVWQHFGYTTDMDAELEKIITDKMAGK